MRPLSTKYFDSQQLNSCRVENFAFNRKKQRNTVSSLFSWEITRATKVNSHFLLILIEYQTFCVCYFWDEKIHPTFSHNEYFFFTKYMCTLKRYFSFCLFVHRRKEEASTKLTVFTLLTAKSWCTRAGIGSCAGTSILTRKTAHSYQQQKKRNISVRAGESAEAVCAMGETNKHTNNKNKPASETILVPYMASLPNHTHSLHVRTYHQKMAKFSHWTSKHYITRLA